MRTYFIYALVASAFYGCEEEEEEIIEPIKEGGIHVHLGSSLFQNRAAEIIGRNATFGDLGDLSGTEQGSLNNYVDEAFLHANSIFCNPVASMNPYDLPGVQCKVNFSRKDDARIIPIAFAPGFFFRGIVNAEARRYLLSGNKAFSNLMLVQSISECEGVVASTDVIEDGDRFWYGCTYPEAGGSFVVDDYADKPYHALVHELGHLLIPGDKLLEKNGHLVCEDHVEVNGFRYFITEEAYMARCEDVGVEENPEVQGHIVIEPVCQRLINPPEININAIEHSGGKVEVYDSDFSWFCK